MEQVKKVWLKAGKERPIERFHPWVFSGAIHKTEEAIDNGDIVLVLSNRDKKLAYGHYFDGNIAIRILSFDANIAINQAFWNDRIKEALQLRLALGFSLDDVNNNCFRLIHGEGDGLSGLIIDYYNGTAVVQLHTDGMLKNLNEIVEALKVTFGTNLLSIYNKSNNTLNAPDNDGCIFGENSSKSTVAENGLSYEVNWEEGQKTGFFLDQRDNRLLLRSLAKDKTVLNTFCYTGGFSISALAGGAAAVNSIDISEKAMELVKLNTNLNQLDDAKHTLICADVMQSLKQNDATYDIVVLDPPAFAKSIRAKHNAVQAYKRLNTWGIGAVKKGGLLFTFSCSQVVDNALFEHTVISAAMASGKQARIIKRLGQSADHPVSAFHPEGSYLKGLLLYIS
jgi:23S rRNA (cytosine1962-C5)-methyltransferase